MRRRYNISYIRNEGSALIQATVSHLRGQIMREASRKSPFYHYVTKCVNVLRELTEHNQEIPFIMEPI